tara:strand:+ start:62 stop:736 length:675 start_codon:yes stop_codon:yes gene_type:complete
MDKNPTFKEFIEHICQRPRMYTLGGTFNETAAFIMGYSSGNTTPISDRVFGQFVCLKNSFPTNYVWTYVIKECTKDDDEAISLMEKTIIEFITLKKTMTDDELIQRVIESSVIEEGETEKIFRTFEQALLAGDKETIQSLIIECNGAEILWSGSYPKDVATKLSEISSNQPIRQIPISEDGNRIKIIAQGWPFAIEMSLVDGDWKVNPEKIIELRKSKKVPNKT